MKTAIGVVTCNQCKHPLDPETLTCDCMDDAPEDYYEQISETDYELYDQWRQEREIERSWR